MDPLDEQLAKLKLMNSYPLSPRVYSELNVFKNPTATGKLCANEVSPKKIGPAVPPKPSKKSPNFPEVPQSMVVRQTCEPLYSKRLQSDSIVKDGRNKITASGKPTTSAGPAVSILHRKQPNYVAHHIYSNNKVTLDNPAILDQQLEALEHHKKQLEKKGLLQNNIAPKLSSASFLSGGGSGIGSNNTGDVAVSTNSATNSYLYSNIRPNLTPTSATLPSQNFDRRKNNEPTGVYSNINHKQQQFASGDNISSGEFIYSNVHYGNNANDLPPPPPLDLSATSNMSNSADYLNQCPAIDDDIPPPPSPVSSSYSELRRATDAYPKLPSYPILTYGKNGGVKSVDGMGNNSSSNPTMQPAGMLGCPSIEQQQTYINMSYHNDYSTYGSPSLQQSFSQSSSDCYGYGSSSQGSSTYESIYEPINPRPPSQLSSRSNYLPYTPYVNSPQFSEGETANSSAIGGSKPTNVGGNLGSGGNGKLQSHKETEVEVLTDLLVHSMDAASDVDSFGICVACNERVVGENSGCTAMDQVYHISCFTCSQCQINLQGKPFYALDGKPYCETDYLNTLEKCSVCMKPILERILRATGKPYHPQCFTCVVCGNSLDGIPFTVDATNQNYCIADFHKKFAPRCCVCKLPIMPEPGQEETVRVVALDRSFHFECYKCEDCGLLLSSEAEGRGCYPLDDHVLCKSCNAKRVQMLTNRMTTEL